MQPTLPVECDIEIIPLPASIRPGDLIVFVAGDALIAHRLVRMRGNSWIAQGDGRPGPDQPLSPDQVLGIVVAAYREGRRCWPTHFSQAWARFWVARYQGMTLARATWHPLRRLLGRR